MKDRFVKKSKFRRPKFLRERGQSLAVMVIALPAVVAAMGLAMDVGNLYFNYYKLQTAADASVLAGALCLPSGDNCNNACGTSFCTPTQTANYYANTLNGVKVGEITGTTVGNGNTTITMAITRTVPYYFARWAGVNQGTVNVSAEAQSGPPTAVNSNNLLPLGLQVCGDPSVTDCPTPYTFGTALTFAAKGDDGPGNWGAVSLPSGTVSICPTGACLSSDPGFAKIKAVIDQANTLISEGTSTDPSGTAASHTPGDPRAVAVPLVDWGPGGVNGNKGLNLYGFAEIWLTSGTNGGPNNSTITATFINQATNGEVGTGGTPFDVGPIVIKLIQ